MSVTMTTKVILTKEVEMITREGEVTVTTGTLIEITTKKAKDTVVITGRDRVRILKDTNKTDAITMSNGTLVILITVTTPGDMRGTREGMRIGMIEETGGQQEEEVVVGSMWMRVVVMIRKLKQQVSTFTCKCTLSTTSVFVKT